jgi:uncharacterized protein
MRRVLWTTAAIAAIVLAMAGLVRAIEARLAFFPFTGEDTTPAQLGVAFSALTIETSDGERLRGWHLPRDDARAQVVYFHGNGGNLSVWSDILIDVWRRGFDVVAIDYRGYGLSTGSPSERGLYRDVDATLALVARQLRRADLPLIYWGRSLGATLAAYGASTRPPDGVILESGFPAARDVFSGNPVMWAVSWLASYRFPTERWMASAAVPVLVLHGDADSVIPYRLGERLYARLRGPKQMFTIRGGDHNDATPRDPDGYWAAVDAFAGGIAATREGSR